jgi:hypothetical protein
MQELEKKGAKNHNLGLGLTAAAVALSDLS